MEIANIDQFEVEELACYITGLNYDEIDGDSEIISEALQEKFGCDIVEFTTIIQHLLPLISIGKSPLTKETYKGFSHPNKSLWFVKWFIKYEVEK